jgi:hypothetical protein
MKVRDNESNEHEETIHGKMIDGATQSYRSFKDYVSIRKDDSLGMTIFKAGLHFLGIIFMLLLSPFFIIGLTIAFAAVI